jgi:hypothetical protein
LPKHHAGTGPNVEDVDCDVLDDQFDIASYKAVLFTVSTYCGLVDFLVLLQVRSCSNPFNRVAA